MLSDLKLPLNCLISYFACNFKNFFFENRFSLFALFVTSTLNVFLSSLPYSVCF